MNIQEFQAILQTRCAIDLKKPVLLGFSGGPDSICLLSLLVKSGVEVTAAHLDHALRPDSAAEAVQAEEICRQLGADFISRRVDVADYAQKKHLSVEEAARKQRYAFLFAEAAKTGAQAVLTGHQADDQVETVLMHLLRGSALSGLAGMRMVLLPNPWSKDIPLVRPLLAFSREEVEAYLSEIPIRPIFDQSNQDSSFFRNRIRNDLLPQLVTYNPQFKKRILRMADAIALEDDLVMAQTRQAWAETVIETGEDFVVFDRAKTASLHPALRRRLMREGLTRLRSELRDMDYQVIEKGSHFFTDPCQSNTVHLIAGLEMFAHLKRRVVLAKKESPLHGLWPQLTQKKALPLKIPGMVSLNEHWTLRSSRETIYINTGDPFVCQLNAELLADKLTIDRFKAGDRFSPYGAAAQEMKLGDFWTNQGLAARARSNWPLIRSGEEIVWVPGFRIADRWRVKKETTSILRLELIKTK